MSVCDVEPLRQWMYGLCIRGDGSFDYASLDALKTRVSLREAKEIEAVLCCAGDTRHTFQMWYGPWLKKNPAKQSAGERIDGDFFDKVAGIHPVDIEQVKYELEGVEEMFDLTESRLQEHRQALALGQESVLPPAIVDVLEDQLEGLTESKRLLQAQLDEAPAKSTPRAGDYGPDVEGGGYSATVVGPVQSGTLRKE